MTLDISPRLRKPNHPYPGLRPFEPDEWTIFFGRELMIDEVIDRLARDRVVLVHGASGSGKSSLIRAGVLPRLARQQRRDNGVWRGCLMRPSGGPLWNLAAAFASVENRTDDIVRIREIVRLLNGANATMSSVTAQLEGSPDSRLCIVIDQFEELFRFAKETSQEEAEAFVGLLTREIADGAQGGAAHVVITMRSEFLGECARFDGLAEAINYTQYLVPRMEREGLVRAISRPAELFNGEIAPALVDRLIAEGRRADDELPLVQYSLMALWNETKARVTHCEKVFVEAKGLEEAGGMATLLSNRADRILATAAPDDALRRIAENILRALTDLNAEGFGIRRPQRFDALVAACGGAEEDVRAILDALRADGVSFVTPYSPTPLEEHTIIDVSHEAVIRCWDMIAASEDGLLIREFRDGQLWRSLVVQARRFVSTKTDLLSSTSTVEVERWLGERNETWTKRYGGNFGLVSSFVEASARVSSELLKAEEEFAEALLGWSEAPKRRPVEGEEAAQTNASQLRRGRVASLLLMRLLRRLQTQFTSSLTRRIVVLNLGGLVALLGGFLYLSQYQKNLIGARLESLETQGKIIAQVMADSASQDSEDFTVIPEEAPTRSPQARQGHADAGHGAPGFPLNPERIGPLLFKFVNTTHTRARVYDRAGDLLWDSQDLIEKAKRAAAAGLSEEKPTAFEELMATLRRWMRPQLELYEDVGEGNGRAYDEVKMALTGELPIPALRANAKGETIVSIAVPIQGHQHILGALMLTTLGGQIDRIISYERWAIIKTFLVSASVMVLLSLLFANAISEPLRKLAAAAKEKLEGGEGQMPDFSDRRDEIGLVSLAFRGMAKAVDFARKLHRIHSTKGPDI